VIYEIRAKQMLSSKSSSIGFYFYNKEIADERCEELNKKMDVYFVSEIKMMDELYAD
jgi:uncharacterized protein (DUF2164 family)